MLDQTQWKRLSWLLGGTMFLVFGAMGAVAKFEEHKWANEVGRSSDRVLKAMDECQKDPASTYCEAIQTFQRYTEEAVVLRDQNDADATLYGGIALITPFVLALIFVGGRWVMTGRLRANSAQTQ